MNCGVIKILTFVKTRNGGTATTNKKPSNDASQCGSLITSPNSRFYRLLVQARVLEQQRVHGDDERTAAHRNRTDFGAQHQAKGWIEYARCDRKRDRVIARRPPQVLRHLGDCCLG